MSLLAVAGGALGAIAGSQQDRSGSSSRSGIDVGPETALEGLATKDITKQYTDLQGMVGLGPGNEDITKSLGSSRSLADLLEAYSKGGFMPGQNDINSANQFTQSIFAPQQTAMNQQFQDQQTQANRLAAQLGRPVNDPIIQAKLAQEQSRQNAMLQSQQTSYSAQYAQNLPMQRLGFASQLADVRGNLASQAMANRQALLSLGQNLRNDDRNYRIQTGTRWGDQSNFSGGGLAGAINGGLAGAGAGLGAAGKLQGMAQSEGIYNQMMGGGSGFSPTASAFTMPSFTSSFAGLTGAPQTSFGLSGRSATQPVFRDFSNPARASGGYGGAGGW